MTTWLTQMIAAFAGCVGFAAILGLRRRYWFLTSAIGMLSWGVYLLCERVMNLFFSNLLATLFCTVSAYILAGHEKTSKTVMLMPAAVPMIPGGSLYYTMYCTLSKDMEMAGRHAMNTISTLFAMAVGFAVVSLAYRFWTESGRRRRAGRG